MGLSEEDLEIDDGTPVAIEQPTQIKTPPLSMNDQDDRIRGVFGLTHDDPLPLVTPETLLTYHHLSTNLMFPFKSRYENPVRSKQEGAVTDHGSGGTRRRSMIDEECGLFGMGSDPDHEIEFPLESIELKRQDPNYRLISDYTYWSQNWR